MNSGQFNLVTKDGHSLFGRVWEPAGKARAVLCLAHGLGEHSGRYENFAGRLGDEGFAVMAFAPYFMV